jgi:hypothetical protein
MKHFEVQTPAAPTKPNKYILRIASFAHTKFRGSSTCSAFKTKLNTFWKVHEHFANQAFKGFNHFPLTLTCYQAHEIPSNTLHSSTQPKHRGSKSIEPTKCRCLVFFCVHLCLPMQEQYHGGRGHKVRASASSFWQIELDKKLKNNQYRLDQSFFYNSTGLHLHTSRLITLHLSVYISAYACNKSLIFLLAPINLRGILNPNPKGILPNCNSRLVCTQTNISKQIQDKQNTEWLLEFKSDK